MRHAAIFAERFFERGHGLAENEIALIENFGHGAVDFRAQFLV